jgi:hypothetical protein
VKLTSKFVFQIIVVCSPGWKCQVFIGHGCALCVVGYALESPRHHTVCGSIFCQSMNWMSDMFGYYNRQMELLILDWRVGIPCSLVFVPVA